MHPLLDTALLPDDWFRLTVILFLGTCAIAGSMVAAWRVAVVLGLPESPFCLLGIAAGLAGFISWLT